jgi:hypothetical protein
MMSWTSCRCMPERRWSSRSGIPTEIAGTAQRGPGSRLLRGGGVGLGGRFTGRIAGQGILENPCINAEIRGQQPAKHLLHIDQAAFRCSHQHAHGPVHRQPPPFGSCQFFAP